MKIGNIVIRKFESYDTWTKKQNEINGYGIVIEVTKSREPYESRRDILTVFYPRSGKIRTIAKGLVKVISENR